MDDGEDESGVDCGRCVGGGRKRGESGRVGWRAARF